MNHSFWRKWLVTVSVLSIGFGVSLAVLAAAPADAFLSGELRRLLFGERAVSADAAVMWRLMCGMTGGVMVGWNVFAFGLAAGPLVRRERWAWMIFAASVAGWFIVDTTASVAVGVWPNVVGNTAYLVLFGLPLAMIAPPRRPGATALDDGAQLEEAGSR